MHLDLRRHLALKFFSLLLAVIIWILTTGESQKIKDLLVPLQYTRLPPGMEISGDAPDRISLRIQAPEPILERITPDRIDARVDLSRLQPGDQYLTLSPEQFKVAGATVVRVDPQVIPVRIVRQAEKDVPVVPRIEGKPPEGYEVVDYRVDPPSVVVVGPEDAVREVHRATTGSIPVDGSTSPREVTVSPVPEAPGGSRVHLKDAGRMVRVRIGIREESVRRVLRDVPVRPRPRDRNVRLRPEAIDVRLSGPASLVDSLDRGNLMVEVNLAGLPPREREDRLAPRVSLVGIPENRAAQVDVEATSRTIAVRIGGGEAGRP